MTKRTRPRAEILDYKQLMTAAGGSGASGGGGSGFHISEIVNAIKGVSSRRYRQAGLTKPHRDALWSPSYFAVSVGGAPIEVSKQYIKDQSLPEERGF